MRDASIMRKTMITTDGERAAAQAEWMDLERLARVEISSEDQLFPIEHALTAAASTGWRAAVTGPQVIRLVFDEPVEIHQIYLHVVERSAERMQEIGIFAELVGLGRQEVRRQQFTFSPGGSTEEIEDFTVTLPQVEALEIRIDPDRSHDRRQSQNYASLMALRLA